MSIDFDQIKMEISHYAKDLALAYIDSWRQDEKEHEAIFSKLIISIFYKYKNHIVFISKMHRADLIDCLSTHTAKYLAFFESKSFPKSEIEQYKLEIDKIINFLKEHVDDANNTSIEYNLCSELTYKITYNAQMLIAVQSHNQSAKDNLLALAIVYSIKLLKPADHNILLNRLLSVKEIWNVESLSEALPNSIKNIFYHNIETYIEINSIDNESSAFEQIIHYFTLTNNIMEHLSDIGLIHLYDRLKNIDTNPIITNLLSLIHIESAYRSNYNRLSDTGYELLSRFQTFDVIMHQIDNLECSLMEFYLLKKDSFLTLFLQSFHKHAEYIHVLGIAREESMHSIINKIEANIYDLPKQDVILTGLFESIKNKLNNLHDVNVKKKINDLDKFQIGSIRTKYLLLFKNIYNLFEDNVLANNFLQETFAHKVASSFHFPNLSNSVDKIRILAKDRKEIKSQILELKLIYIFNTVGLTNKISNFDFKKIALLPEVKSATDFAYAVVKNIISNCSILQLGTLYDNLINKENLTNHQLFLKNLIRGEALTRKTFTIKLLSFISSNIKREYDCLKEIVES